MTILVTGAAGYVGSMIVHQLHRYYDQPKVIGVDNLSTGYTCNLPHGFECFMGDVGHAPFIRNLINRYKVKQIIHCAASVVVPESVADPMAYYHNNTVKSFDLIRMAIREKVESFVFSSTAAVYGQPEFPRPMREDDPCRPCSPYGASKLMVERFLQDAYVAHGMNTVILRYFNVAGADPLMQTGQTSPKATHLIKRATQAALGMTKLQVFGDDFPTPDGTAIRDYVHVADIAAAHTHALEWNARHNGCLILNVGTGLGYSVREVMVEVQRAAGKVVPWTYAQRREGDPASIMADTRLIKQRFNWEPQYDLKAMVEHALKWEKTL